MENNSGFSATDAVLTSAMSGGFGGNRGGGQWGGGYNGGPYANFSSIQHGIDGHARNMMGQFECGREIVDAQISGFKDSFEGLQRDNQFTATNKNISDAALRSASQVAGIELNALREKADITRQMAECCCDTKAAIAEAAKEAAACCCEAKLQACKDTSDLKALVISENAATRAMINGNALDAANAELTQLKTINALKNNGHGGH